MSAQQFRKAVFADITAADTPTGAIALADTGGPVVVSASGTFTGTIVPEYQHGSDAPWIRDDEATSQITKAALKLFQNPGDGVSIRLTASAWTSGTANVRITQNSNGTSR